jgi:hypothetical protein
MRRTKQKPCHFAEVFENQCFSGRQTAVFWQKAGFAKNMTAIIC